jgi:hypothetical protein
MSEYEIRVNGELKASIQSEEGDQVEVTARDANGNSRYVHFEIDDARKAGRPAIAILVTRGEPQDSNLASREGVPPEREPDEGKREAERVKEDSTGSEQSVSSGDSLGRAPKTLEDMTVAELKALATERGIKPGVELPRKPKKAELIDALEQAETTAPTGSASAGAVASLGREG